MKTEKNIVRYYPEDCGEYTDQMILMSLYHLAGGDAASKGGMVIKCKDEQWLSIHYLNGSVRKYSVTEYESGVEAVSNVFMPKGKVKSMVAGICEFIKTHNGLEEITITIF